VQEILKEKFVLNKTKFIKNENRTDLYRMFGSGAYYIISDGEAIIIDPLRETKPYLTVWKKIK
jgi:hypothetical protein